MLAVNTLLPLFSCSNEAASFCHVQAGFSSKEAYQEQHLCASSQQNTCVVQSSFSLKSSSPSAGVHAQSCWQGTGSILGPSQYQQSMEQQQLLFLDRCCCLVQTSFLVRHDSRSEGSSYPFWTFFPCPCAGVIPLAKELIVNGAFEVLAVNESLNNIMAAEPCCSCFMQVLFPE